MQNHHRILRNRFGAGIFALIAAASTAACSGSSGKSARSSAKQTKTTIPTDFKYVDKNHTYSSDEAQKVTYPGGFALISGDRAVMFADTLPPELGGQEFALAAVARCVASLHGQLGSVTNISSVLAPDEGFVGESIASTRVTLEHGSVIGLIRSYSEHSVISVAANGIDGSLKTPKDCAAEIDF